MPVDTVLLAEPRGFCAGVEMAIKALAWMVRAFEPPVYCYHEIVHNQRVVQRFRDLGVVFVDDVAEVPPGAPIMLSAHGSAPEVTAAARAGGGYVVDAVCPLVTKVHHEVKVRAGKGYRIVYVGHEGHEEAAGTMAVAPEAIHLVETPADVAALPPFDEPVALLAQTTLSHRDWAGVADRTVYAGQEATEGAAGTVAVPPGPIPLGEPPPAVAALPPFDEPVALLAQTTLSHRDWAGVADAVAERFPDRWMPGRSDLCFATTNRQSALMEIAPRCDAIVVIGSANSSNTRALEKLATEAGCGRVFRINDASELP